MRHNENEYFCSFYLIEFNDVHQMFIIQKHRVDSVAICRLFTESILEVSRFDDTRIVND